MKLAIYGYGNIGRGVEAAVRQNPDMTLTGVYTRRDPGSVKTKTGVPVYAAADILKHKDEIDVLMICGGSATDLPVLTPMLAKDFNVVDSFDTHARIPEHFANVDASAKAGGHTALISGSDYTFWGRGVSQGHSDAIRRIPGVADARQYTVPVPEALEAVRSGKCPELTTRQKHTRECYVVAKEGADKAAIEQAIKTMPNYFDEYDTTVTFITAEEMARDHAELPHGGFVIRTGVSGLQNEHTHTIEYRLTLDSNPEFTALVLVALARAVGRHAQKGDYGCKTVFDMAPADLSPLSAEELRAHML